MNLESPRNPVLLIHGIFDTTTIFHEMSAYLKERNWEVHSFNLTPNNGLLGLERLAGQIEKYITQHFSSDQPIDLIGFSMGGIVSRYYVQRLGGISLVQRFITISAPHHGTQTAYFYPLPGGKQMCPNCEFLDDLNQDIEMLNQLNFTSIWTPFDAMIIPAKSSQVPVGEDFQVDVLYHAWMVSDRRTLSIIEKALSAPLRITGTSSV
ncbi:MAG: triacylglycerol lipase [Oscillatoriales cyanobacterium RM2_1_1]|nr:triacylglycerol lipase [Oscillatoriales cyanobacterium SM2_3_0]NJO46053.1 triacylglycerol lipase [Oscillatoriales cyanobacterium RM2_1_1]